MHLIGLIIGAFLAGCFVGALVMKWRIRRVLAKTIVAHQGAEDARDLLTYLQALRPGGANLGEAERELYEACAEKTKGVIALLRQWADALEADGT